MIIKEAHKHGIKVLTYGKGFGAGPPYFELLRRHPEWILFNSHGRLEGYGDVFNIRDLNHWNEGWFQGKKHWSSWPNAYINLANLEAVDYGINELIGSAKMFGWDGVRFDSHFKVFDGYNLDGQRIIRPGETRDSLTVRNTKRVKEKIWKEIPNYLFGYNWGPQYSHPGGGSSSPLDYAETCKGGGLIMNEQLRGSWSLLDDAPHRPNKWMEYTKVIISDVKRVRKLGGYYCVIHVDKCYPIDAIYSEILIPASGAHIWWGGKFQPRYGDYAQFTTRYSAFIWDDRIKQLENPEAMFRVMSTKDIWWKEFANERILSKEHRQFILHLINPPVCKRIFQDETNTAPPRQKGVEISAKIPKGYRVKNIWLLTAEPTTHGTTLPFKVSGEQTDVTVPELVFWDIVVFDLIGK